jgi:hypothetical protein
VRAAGTAAAAVRTPPSPGCSTATTTGPVLSGVRTAMAAVPGTPYGIAVTPDRRWAFTALIDSVEVLHIGRSLAPAPVRTVPVPPGPEGLAGEALTRDGRYLLVATGSGAVVVSTVRAEQGSANAEQPLRSGPSGRRAGHSVGSPGPPGNSECLGTPQCK